MYLSHNLTKELLCALGGFIYGSARPLQRGAGGAQLLVTALERIAVVSLTKNERRTVNIGNALLRRW